MTITTDRSKTDIGIGDLIKIVEFGYDKTYTYRAIGVDGDFIWIKTLASQDRFHLPRSYLQKVDL